MLDSFGIVEAQQIDIVTDDSIGIVKVKNCHRITSVSHIGKDMAYLSFYIVSILGEELEGALDERVRVDNSLNLRLASSSDIRDHPARLPPQNFLLVM
jgi:hypothetical protein